MNKIPEEYSFMSRTDLTFSEKSIIDAILSEEKIQGTDKPKIPFQRFSDTYDIPYGLPQKIIYWLELKKIIKREIAFKEGTKSKITQYQLDKTKIRKRTRIRKSK
jgi:hypothetical protein